MHMIRGIDMHPPGTWYLFLLLVLLAPFDSFAVTKNGFVLDDALVPSKQIRSGGPGRDGIASLDHPEFIFARDANFLSNDQVRF